MSCTLTIVHDGVEDSTVGATRRIGHQLERSGLRIQVISLAAGIGRDAAILCGLIAVETVSGMVAVMDGDDQHPVETLGLPLERAGDGVLVAVAVSQDNPPRREFLPEKDA